jgi:hypothetical protein
MNVPVHGMLRTNGSSVFVGENGQGSCEAACSAPWKGISCDEACAIPHCQFVRFGEWATCMGTLETSADAARSVLDTIDDVLPFYAFTDFSIDSEAAAAEAMDAGDGDGSSIYPLAVDLRARLAEIRAYYLSNLLAGERVPSSRLHDELASLFNSLNDAHTAWIKPDSYSSTYAIYPLLLAVVGEQRVDGAEQRVLVADAWFQQFAWLVGSRVTHLAGVPAIDYLIEFADTVGISRDLGTRFNLAVNAFSVRGMHAGVIGSVPRVVDARIEIDTANGTLARVFPLPFLAYSMQELASRTSLEALEEAPDGDDDDARRREPSIDSVDDVLALRIVSPQSLFAAAADGNHDDDDDDDDDDEARQQQQSLPFALSADEQQFIELARQSKEQAKRGVGDDDGEEEFDMETIVQTQAVDAYRFGDDALIVHIKSFSPSDYQQFRFAVTYALLYAQDNGLSNLMIDLSDDGGGSICLGYAVLEYLLGDEFDPYGSYDFPAPPLAQEMALRSASNETDHDLSLWAPEYWVSPATGEPFDDASWMVPPVTLTRNGHAQGYSQRVHDGCQHSFESWLRPHHYSYSPTQILLFSHGFAGSTAAVFSKHLAESRNARSLVVGGIANRPQSVASFPGGQVYTLGALSDTLELLELDGSDDAPQRLPVTARLSFTVREIYSWTPRYANVPLDFVFEPADFRMLYSERALRVGRPALYADAVQFFERCLGEDDRRPCDVGHGVGANHCMRVVDGLDGLFEWGRQCIVSACDAGYEPHGPAARRACMACAAGAYKESASLDACQPCTNAIPAHSRYVAPDEPEHASSPSCPYECDEGYRGEQCLADRVATTTPAQTHTTTPTLAQTTTPHPTTTPPPSSSSSATPTTSDTDATFVITVVVGVIVLVAIVGGVAFWWYKRRQGGADSAQPYREMLTSSQFIEDDEDEDDAGEFGRRVEMTEI